MPETTRPNILYLFSDQHAAHTLGCYGNHQVRTPNLDKLAGDGVQFDNAFSQCGICAPSRMSIYTGCYPATLGAHGNLCRYPDNLPPLIPHLQDAGYFTAAVGKMHFVPGRRCPGFDVMRLTRGGTDALPDDDWRTWLIEQDKSYETRWPFGEHPDFFDGHPDFGPNHHLLNWDLPPEHYVDNWVAGETVRTLSERPKDKPFFMWAGFTRPHDPYAPPPPYDSMYDPASLELCPKPWGSFKKCSSSHEKLVENKIEAFVPPHHDDYEGWLRDALAAFYGQVSLVDDCVGRVLRTLDDLGIADNTIVVYGADHGDFAGRYDMMGKLISGNDALLRVPMLWRVPGLKSGMRHKGLVENIDVFPTLFDLARLPIPEQCQGQSLRPVLEGCEVNGKPAVFFQDEPADGIRTDEWIYVRHNNGEQELYDVKNDPRQETNIAQQEPRHPMLSELAGRLTNAPVASVEFERKPTD